MIVGGTSSGVGTYYDAVVLKYSSAGALLWEQQYDGPASDEDFGYSISLDSSNGVLVTGTSVGTGNDIATIRYDTDGNAALGAALRRDREPRRLRLHAGGERFGLRRRHLNFRVPLPFPGHDDQHDSPIHADDIGFLAHLDEDGNVVLVGFSQRGSQQVDTLLIKYGPKTKFAPVQGPPEVEDPIQPLVQATPRKPTRAVPRSPTPASPEALYRLPFFGWRSAH